MVTTDFFSETFPKRSYIGVWTNLVSETFLENKKKIIWKVSKTVSMWTQWKKTCNALFCL